MSQIESETDLHPSSFVRFTSKVTGILYAVSRVLDNEAEPAEYRVRRAGALLRDYPRRLIEESPPSLQQPVRTVRGGLLAWQIRRLKDYVEAHLAESICVQDMAAVLGLSPSHFCRSFRLSVAISPHNYVMRRRIERAQTLMLTTNAPLIRIATDCGLADQAHLNRVFRRLTGETPGAWRRIRGGAKVTTSVLKTSQREHAG